MLHQHIAQGLILLLRSHDDDIIVILGSRTNQRDAAYINFFDNRLMVGTAGYGSLEGIEIHNHQVNLRNFIFLNLLHILLQSAATEDATEHLRMQRLHASAQNRGIGSEVFHRLAGIAQRLNELACTAR